MKQFLLLLTLGSFSLWGASTPQSLTTQKCAKCHLLTTPSFEQLSSLKAPAMDAVVFHLNLAFETEEEKKAFIVAYVLHPQKEKSVCESNKVAKFGLMPSQKGSVTKEELFVIADYLLQNYPAKSFVGMIKEVQKNDKMNALLHSPFLLNSEGLPHMTKRLMQTWDKEALGLSPAQKEALLVIRKETRSKLKEIKALLQPLEEEVVETMIDRESPKRLERTLEKIARLKLEATRVHLHCIDKTTHILTPEQVEYLFPFWE